MLKILISFLITTFLFTGCTNSLFNSSTQQKVQTQEEVPQWMTDANYIKNKRSAIGCAGVHYKGESAQKKLAISRAIDQIAMQKKTTVSTQTLRKSSSNKLNSSQTSSLQSTDNIELSTKVVEEYYDKKNNRLCVLVVEE
jgi:PBP1b-binding outer membrane lipoprotein LpoB